MEQFVPQVTREDIDRVLRRDFATEHHDELRALIEAIQVIEKHRVILGCMKNAGGDVDKLKRNLGEATGYYREILLEAEYPNYAKKWSRFDKLSEAERRKIVEKDKNQYLAWLNR
ncbi:MAG TPA: hypothetical protein VFW45_11715 [Candidatus Polarisedimenticolia bacterium]|nr:hypothetical protein [Candidatus Polarisedimenticolia bacterium]